MQTTVTGFAVTHGKAKAGMVHSVSGWMRGVQVKLRSLRMCAIPEHIRGVFMIRHYTNSDLPLPYLTPEFSVAVVTEVLCGSLLLLTVLWHLCLSGLWCTRSQSVSSWKRSVSVMHCVWYHCVVRVRQRLILHLWVIPLCLLDSLILL